MEQRNHLIDIQGLTIQYKTRKGVVAAVNGIDLAVERGETLGLVGETGAGKTTTALGILRLVPDPPGKITAGKIFFEGTDLLSLPPKEMRIIRGEKISMIFQDPMTALNPIMTVGEQIAEMIRLHKKVSPAEAVCRAGEMLERVGIPSERYHEYPHQFSGGMKQRVVIAIALACDPALLIADEPTTALDVTIQAQVLDMMNKLKKELGTSMILITHDLGIVAEICDKVAIMYAGEVVEIGTAEDIYDHYCHPYTEGLFHSIPSLEEETERLAPIPGMMPDPTALPSGCSFAPRCPYCTEKCEAAGKIDMVYLNGTHGVRCLRSKVRKEEVN